MTALEADALAQTPETLLGAPEADARGGEMISTLEDDESCSCELCRPSPSPIVTLDLPPAEGVAETLDATPVGLVDTVGTLVTAVVLLPVVVDVVVVLVDALEVTAGAVTPGVAPESLDAGPDMVSAGWKLG